MRGLTMARTPEKSRIGVFPKRACFVLRAPRKEQWKQSLERVGSLLVLFQSPLLVIFTFSAFTRHQPRREKKKSREKEILSHCLHHPPILSTQHSLSRHTNFAFAASKGAWRRGKQRATGRGEEAVGEGTGRERALLGKIGAVCCACTPSSAGVTAVDFCDLGDLLTFVYCSVRRKNKGASAAATSTPPLSSLRYL